MKKPESPRGIRNNNPGNLRRAGDKWQGLIQPQPDPAYCTFINPVYGVRALARTLITYQINHNLRTIREIIGRWAPSVENDTVAYIRAIVEDTGFLADQVLDMHVYADLKPLVLAIIKHENGMQPYTAVQIDKALVLAGVEPPVKSLQKSRTVKGGQTAAAATVGVSALEAIRQNIDPARESLQILVPYLDVAKWLLLGLTLVGVGIMIWARIDDRRKGLR